MSAIVIAASRWRSHPYDSASRFGVRLSDGSNGSALDTEGPTTNNRPNMSASLVSASTGRLQARYGFAYFGV